MLKLLILVVIIVLALSYFGISIEKLATSHQAQANFVYLWHLTLQAWHWIVQQYQLYAAPYLQPYLSKYFGK